MSNFPAPSGPRSDDETEDAARGAVSSAWHGALEWAERGDYRLMVSLLRSETSMQDDTHVRAFLAGVLEGTVKRPRGKPTLKPDRKWAPNADGHVDMIDAADERAFAIRNWVRENKAAHGDRVHEIAAKHFQMDEEAIRNTVRRSSRAWKRST